MKTLEFFQLSRAVQDRFTHAAQGLSQPMPVLFSARTDSRWQWALGGACVALLLSLAALAIGFGQSDSPLAIAPAWMGGVSAALVFSFCVALVIARVRFTAPRRLPYRQGIYLFPFGVVDAAAPTFRLFGLDELLAVDVVGGDVQLKFKEGQFRFGAGRAEHAAALSESLGAAKLKYEEALKQMNARDLASLDPLRDTGFSNPFSPKTPHVLPSQRGFVRLALIGALPFSLALGWGALELRNRLSEERLFQHAEKINTPDAYQTYLARGGKRALVSEILLPRAELAVAAASKSVPKLEAFALAHPASKIENEVTAALKQALLAELKLAEARGELAALRAFNDRFLAHRALFSTEYTRSLSQFYAGVLSRYKASPRYSEKLFGFVTQLLNFSKSFEGAAEVRFRRVLRPSLTMADQQVRKSIHFMGAESVPSQYFDAAHSAPREAKIGAALREKWQEILPEDVLRFELGKVVEEPEGTPVVFKVPTLLVEYVVGGAGIYLSKKPRGVFVGVGLVFSAKFTIPDVAESLEFKASSWKVPELTGLANGEGTVASVYEVLAQESFDRFFRLYEAEYFQGNDSGQVKAQAP